MSPIEPFVYRAGIAAIIPAYNEAACIGRTVAAARGVPSVELVLVVDDGSRDATAREAAAAGAQVLRLPVNGGKGGALNAGMSRVRAGIYLFLDADLGATAAEGARLLAPLLRRRADLAVANFPPARGAGFGLAVGLARWGISRLCGRELKAPLSGQRAFTHRVWRAVRPLAPGFGAELAMTVRALRGGLRVEEVPTQMTHRVTGWRPADCLHRARQGLAVAAALLVVLPEVASNGGEGISSHSVNV